MKAGTFDQRVLVADDDPMVQQMFRTLLEREGIRADVVSDGHTAVQLVRSREYHALLLDLMLPRMNGFEVIRDLKCVKPNMLKRVIVVTAVSERTLQYLDRKDVRTVIRKPFDIADLIAEVRGCIGLPSSGGPNRAPHS